MARRAHLLNADGRVGEWRRGGHRRGWKVNSCDVQIEVDC
jgi:hypothetical protein